MFLPSAYQHSWLATQQHLQYIHLFGIYYSMQLRFVWIPGHSQEPRYLCNIITSEKMRYVKGWLKLFANSKARSNLQRPLHTAVSIYIINTYLFHILAWCFLIFICTPYMVPNHRQPDCRYNPSKKTTHLAKLTLFQVLTSNVQTKNKNHENYSWNSSSK